MPWSLSLVAGIGQIWSRPEAQRPAFQAAGGKDGVAQRGAHLQMGDEARRGPRRSHQRPKGARPSGTSDAQDLAGNDHWFCIHCAPVRRAGLSLVMFVIGLALIGGALTVLVPSSLVPDTFRPLDHYVGTEGSVVGAAFGLGLIWAAFRPGRNRIWVHLAMLYGILLMVREGTHPSNGTSPSLQPILFGLATVAVLSSPRITARARATGVISGSRRRRLTTSGTGGSGRGTMRCPITPTDFTYRRFGVTVRTTGTWLPGTLLSLAGSTRYCSWPPR